MKKGIWVLGFMLVFSVLVCPASVDASDREIRELEKRIKALEEEKWGFRPDRAEWLEFGGEKRLELIVPEKADSYAGLDRVEIDLKATITEGVYSKGTLKFEETRVEVDEWYTRFSLEDHWLKAGLTDRFIKPRDLDLGDRKTAGYPLGGIAFWRDEQYNLTFGGMFPEVMGGDIRYRLSYGSGLILGRRRPGDHTFTDPGVRVEDRLIHDDDHGQLGDEIGLGLGYRYHFGEKDTLDLVGFGIWSRANSPHADVRGLIGWPKEKDQQRIGGRVVYRPGASMFMAEYIDAKDGRLDRDAWYLQASHKVEFPDPLIGGRFFTAVEPLIRYGEYDVDTAKVFRNPLTWDREQLTLALLCDITKNVSLRLECDINDERTGGRGIGNDEFRAQLRTRW